MALSMYQCSVPAFEKSLNGIKGVLAKAAAFAEAKKFDGTVLTSARLYPDMFALARQVQVATDLAKGCVARLAGVDIPKYDDNETTLAELTARVDKTLAFIASVKPAQIDGTEAREITLKLGPNEMKFTGQDYLLGFVLANFYFHAAATYAILRHNGVELTKRDYLGA